MKTMPSRAAQRERRFEGQRKDPYGPAGKLPSPTVCPLCRAVYRDGKWTWSEDRPRGARRQPCEACRRIRDAYPAGWLTLKGGYAKRHRRELLNIALNCQRSESADHPLNRIMGVEDKADGIVVATTDIHLPRLIGETVRRAHKGRLQVTHDAHGYAARAVWTRGGAL